VGYVVAGFGVFYGSFMGWAACFGCPPAVAKVGKKTTLPTQQNIT